MNKATRHQHRHKIIKEMVCPKCGSKRKDFVGDHYDIDKKERIPETILCLNCGYDFIKHK